MESPGYDDSNGEKEVDADIKEYGREVKKELQEKEHHDPEYTW